jgi:hypothetical protein
MQAKELDARARDLFVTGATGAKKTKAAAK